MDDLAIGQQGGQDLAHRPVDLVRALGAAGDVDDRQGAVQREVPAGGLARSAQQFGSQRIAGEDHPVRRELVSAHREAESDPPGEARDDPVGEAGDGRLFVDDDGDGERAGGESRGQGHEAARGEEERWPEPAEQPPRLGGARRRSQGEVGHVLPVPVAAELPRVDGVERKPGLGDAPGLDALAATDPMDVGAALLKLRRDGQPRAGVPARTASRDDDAHGQRGGQRRRSRASSMRRVISSG